jgi:hypothetical protein
MQSQTSENDHAHVNVNNDKLNDDVQIVQFDPEVDIQMYDLNACELTAVNLTSDIVAEAEDTPTITVTRKNPERHYFKWSFHEINQLHREAQIMDLTIQEIAKRHQRTNSAILFKLKEEKLIKWDCSLDNTNMRTVLEYYNNYLRNYHEVEDEDEEVEDYIPLSNRDNGSNDDEDYVPSSDYEDEDDDDDDVDEKQVVDAPLFQIKMGALSNFEKALLTHGYTIYCAVVLSTYVVIFIYCTFFKY